MVALSLCDGMFTTDNPQRSGRLARRLIESMLLDRKEIEKFDESLAPEDPLQFDRQSAALIRKMYEQWAGDADALLDRISQIEHHIGRIPEADELLHAVGKTMAMLSISLDDMDAGCRDIKEGRLHSAEEVRRELQLPTR